MDEILIARNAILEELKRRAKAGDKLVYANSPNGHWHTPQSNYYSGAGEMTCPVCNIGKLRYSRSSYNGHVHGRCLTAGCVSWME